MHGFVTSVLLAGALVSAEPPTAPIDEPVNVEQVSLDELLNRSPVSGSIGRLLKRAVGDLPIEPFMHSYLTFDATHHLGHDALEFDLHYFNLFFGAEIANLVVPELQLEIEHGHEFAIRTGQVDFRIHELAVIRLGLFLVPFGAINEQHYPELFSKLPRGPLVLTHRHIVPVGWSDVGIQVRGHHEFSPGWSVGYAAWAGNGLEQADDPSTETVDSGGDLRSMRGNFRDQNHPDKAVGLRIYGELAGALTLGVSAYHGAYTTDGESRLTLVGADADLHIGPVVWRTEGAAAFVGTPSGTLTRWGVYSRVAWHALPWLEPAVGVDLVALDTESGLDTWQVVVGVNVYPFPTLAPHVLTRLAWATRRNVDSHDEAVEHDHGSDDHLMLQVSLGF